MNKNEINLEILIFQNIFSKFYTDHNEISKNKLKSGGIGNLIYSVCQNHAQQVVRYLPSKTKLTRFCKNPYKIKISAINLIPIVFVSGLNQDFFSSHFRKSIIGAEDVEQFNNFKYGKD